MAKHGGLRLVAKSAGCEPANARFDSGSLPQWSMTHLVVGTRLISVYSKVRFLGRLPMAPSHPESAPACRLRLYNWDQSPSLVAWQGHTFARDSQPVVSAAIL